MFYNTTFQCVLLVVCLFVSTVEEGVDEISSSHTPETKDRYLPSNVSSNYTIIDITEHKSERVRYLENVKKLVWLIFAPVLLFVGLIGNTLSILVLRR